MNIKYIRIISRYESLLFYRGWVFKLFVPCVLGINMLQLFIQGNLGLNEWYWIGLPSSIPYFQALSFNILQILFVIFAIHEALKREEQDTEASLLVRPISNVERCIGQVIGIVKVVLGTCIFSMLLSMFVNVFVSDSPFSFWIYIFYFLTLVLPGLIFTAGISMLFLVLGRNRVMVCFLLVLCFGVVSLYLYDLGNGFWDFTTRAVPNLFSGVTGHVNLWYYVLQRLAWLVAGMGMLFLSISFSRRLPNRLKSVRMMKRVGVFYFIVWVLIGALYSFTQVHEVKKRREYVQALARYVGEQKGDLESLSLVFQQSGDRFSGDCKLVVKNTSGNDMERLLLFLNPGLKVERVSDSDNELSFIRDRQVLVIDVFIASGDSVTLRVLYAGWVDGSVCYLDIPDKEYYQTSTNIGFFRFGKQYVFLEKEQTLLIPECLWYPVTCPPANPENSGEEGKNFSRYSLSVLGETDRVVLSQGVKTYRGDTVCFTSEERLTGMTLCAGDYEEKSVILDSVLYSLNYFRGHDFFLEALDNSEFNLSKALKDCESFLYSKNKTGYLFRRFTLVETPLAFASYYRKRKGGSDRVQPELVLLPEYAVTMAKSNFKGLIKAGMNPRRVFGGWVANNFGVPRMQFRKVSLKPGSSLSPSEDLHEFETEKNPFYIFPLWSYHVMGIRSGKYPLLDVFFSTFFNLSLKGLDDRISNQVFDQYLEMPALDYFNTKSLVDAADDNDLSQELLEQMLRIKCSHLRKWVTLQIEEEKLDRFLKGVVTSSRFCELSLEDFENRMKDSLGIDIAPLVEKVYTSKGLPVFEVKDARMRKIETEEYSGYQLSCKVFNSGVADGIFTFGGVYGYGADKEILKDYYIPAGEAREVWFSCDKKLLDLGCLTNMSGNRPMEFWIDYDEKREIITDYTSGEQKIDLGYFQKDGDAVIVVDDQDSGFSLIDAISRNKIYSLFRNGQGGEKYKRPVSAPGTWRVAYSSKYYGHPERTACYKIAGSGKSKAIWRADIPKKGIYEVFVSNLSDYQASSLFAFITSVHSISRVFQHYTLYHGEGVEEIEQKMDPRREIKWISLGRFYFNVGEVKLELSDKGVEGQLIFADVVKWVRVSE